MAGPSAVAVFDGLRAVARGIDHYRHTVAARHALGIPEIITLGQLLHETDVRAGDIAARTGLGASSVTALLDRLERRGLVRRVRRPSNRRVVLVELTDEGRREAAAMTGDVPPLLNAIADEHLARSLHHIARLLEAAAVDGASPDSSL